MDIKSRKICCYYIDTEEENHARYVCCARINSDVSFAHTSRSLSGLEAIVKKSFTMSGHLYLWEENMISIVKWEKTIEELLEFVTENPLFKLNESSPRGVYENSLSQESLVERFNGHSINILDKQ